MTDFKREQWKERIARRPDLAANITHLTRGDDPVGNVVSMLRRGKIDALSAGYIRGGTAVVCFQDVPAYALAQNIDHERSRYSGCGLAFGKLTAWERGARPVLYDEDDVTKSPLPREQRWRSVGTRFSTDPDALLVDWSHEREWRHPGDFLFEPWDAIVIVQRTEEYRDFILRMVDSTWGRETLSALRGLVTLGGGLM